MEEKLVCLCAMCLVLWVGCSAESGGADSASQAANPVDIAEIRKAAEAGDAIAQIRLAMCYYRADGVPKDDQECVKWLRRAAEQGDPYGQYNLGVHYFTGEGVDVDNVEAMKWCRKAAEQGLTWAQHNVGMRYIHGDGVAEDQEEGVKWLTKAAEQGLDVSQFNLACNYASGEGVPKDDIEAYVWYSMAAQTSDDGEAKGRRDEIWGKMSPEQRAEAEKRYVERRGRLKTWSDDPRRNANSNITAQVSDLSITLTCPHTSGKSEDGQTIWISPGLLLVHGSLHFSAPLASEEDLTATLSIGTESSPCQISAKDTGKCDYTFGGTLQALPRRFSIFISGFGEIPVDPLPPQKNGLETAVIEPPEIQKEHVINPTSGGTNEKLDQVTFMLRIRNASACTWKFDPVDIVHAVDGSGRPLSEVLYQDPAICPAITLAPGEERQVELHFCAREVVGVPRLSCNSLLEIVEAGPAS